jgi:hypothetical protein
MAGDGHWRKRAPNCPEWSVSYSDKFGGRCRARTDDLLVVSQLLYQLS